MDAACALRYPAMLFGRSNLQRDTTDILNFRVKICVLKHLLRDISVIRYPRNGPSRNFNL